MVKKFKIHVLPKKLKRLKQQYIFSTDPKTIWEPVYFIYPVNKLFKFKTSYIKQ